MYIKTLLEEIFEYSKKLKNRKAVCKKNSEDWEKDSKCQAYDSKIRELKKRVRAIEMAAILRNEEILRRFNDNGRTQYAKKVYIGK